jgi:hypothetical protein
VAFFENSALRIYSDSILGIGLFDLVEDYPCLDWDSGSDEESSGLVDEAAGN